MQGGGQDALWAEDLEPPQPSLLLSGGEEAEPFGCKEVARDIVVDCIVHDPRWDHQVEERGWYYASLVTELEIDLKRLRQAFTTPPDPSGDSDAWLTTSVFELVARRGYPSGIAELRLYLRSDRDFHLAMSHLLPIADQPGAEGLMEEVLEHADDDQLREAIFWNAHVEDEPWSTWRRSSPRLDRLTQDALAERTLPINSMPASRGARRREIDRSMLVDAGRKAPPGSVTSQLASAGDEEGEDALPPGGRRCLQRPERRATRTERASSNGVADAFTRRAVVGSPARLA